MSISAAWSRTVAFTFAMITTVSMGHVGFLPDEMLSLSWPASGVIVLWAHLLRNRSELAAYIAVTFTTIAVVNLQIGLPFLDSVTYAVANVMLGLATLWGSLALVPFGRRLGLVSRISGATGQRPATEVISRLVAPL